MRVEYNTVRNGLPFLKTTSAWSHGVKLYAMDMLVDVDPEKFDACNTREELQTLLLNGAIGWHEYSEGGCALIYDADIAERLCPPSTLARKRGGDLPPNNRESWLDVQARALRQAFRLIYTLANFPE